MVRKLLCIEPSWPLGCIVIVLIGIAFVDFRPADRAAEKQALSSAACPSFRESRPILEAREQLAAASINVGEQNFIYAVGGLDSSGAVVNTVFYTQVLTEGQVGRWKVRRNAFGEALKYPALISTQGMLYVLGGKDRHGRSMDSVYRARPQAVTGDTTWLPDESLPISVYLHSAASLGDRVYAIGGCHRKCSSSPTVADVFSARMLGNGQLSSWESESSLAQLARDGISAHTAVASEDHHCIYVIGGWLGSYSSGSPHDRVFRACVTGNGKLGAWQEESEALPLILPGADGLYYHSAAVVDDRVFVMGGAVYKSGSPQPTDSVYVGSIDASGHLGNWVACAHCLPGNLERQGVAVASNGAIYILGGRDRATSSVYDTVLFTPLLDFQKFARPEGPVTYGDTINYTLKLTNLGVRDLRNLVITDTVRASVPAVLEFHGLPGECQPYSGTDSIITSTCTIPNLALGDTRILDFKVTIAQPVSALLSTSNPLQDPFDERAAEADASESSITNQRNQDGIPSVLTPDCDADLCIEKADNPDPVMPGETLTYTLTITNEGPADAEDVSVLDYLPPDFEVVATTPVTISGPNPLQWRLPNMSAGQSEEIQVVGTVDPDSTDVILNVAMALSDIDSSLANNVSEEWTAIGSLADLSIAKIDDPDPVNAGEMLTYTLWITNEGPSPATNVIVTDTLSGVVCNLDCLPPHCHLSPSVYDPGMVVCDLGTVPAGECEGIRVRAMVYPTSTVALTNTAEVRSDVPDSTPRNNKVQERTAINTLADLSVEKSDNVNRVIAGDVLVYTLRVNNDGPSYAHNVEVSDTLPTGVSFQSSVPTVTSGPDPLMWYTDTLTVGEVWTIEITVAVNSSVVGLLTNTACVISDDDLDPHPLNNCDEEETLTLVPVINKALVCEDGLWCKETEFFNFPFNVYLPIVLKSSV